MGFARRLHSIFSCKSKVKPTIDVSSPVLINVNILRHHNITCHCKSMAIPIGVQGNEYRCVKCDNRIIGINYNFGNRYITDGSLNTLSKEAVQLLDMAYYDDAVVFLKSERYY